jgi:zeta-carotene desaturase
MSDVVVIGAGLAGLSAALALASDGAEVTLLDRRPEIGGRAYSYPHPALAEVVDSQHVMLGCCTNLVDLCRQAGTAGLIRWYDELTFLEPNGNRSVMRPGPLPAPAHQTLSFLRAPMLSVADKAGIATGLSEFLSGYPASDEESFSTWLQRTRQTERAIRHFWEPVVIGALNDTFERCSTKYAGKVFHETFLRSPAGGRLGIPTKPLTEFFAPVAAHAEAKGVLVDRKTGADEIRREGNRWRIRSGERWLETENVLIATDFRQAQSLAGSLLGWPAASAFLAAPITTVHLWFDRDVTGIDHAVLLDTRIQWVFAKSRIRGWAPERGSYLELTISASWPELKLSPQQILASALEEARLFFPAIHEAKLLKSTVLKEARATFSVTPGLDRHRPAQATSLPGLYLAGDWTQTEWPSTMEGAVRSGRLAAGAITGEPLRHLTPELPPAGLMRWLSKSQPPLSKQ